MGIFSRRRTDNNHQISKDTTPNSGKAPDVSQLTEAAPLDTVDVDFSSGHAWTQASRGDTIPIQSAIHLGPVLQLAAEPQLQLPHLYMIIDPQKAETLHSMVRLEKTHVWLRAAGNPTAPGEIHAWFKSESWQYVVHTQPATLNTAQRYLAPN